MIPDSIALSWPLLSALEQLPLAAFFKDAQGIYRWSNYAWQELVDLDMAALNGQSDETIFTEAFAAELSRNDSSCLKSGRAVCDDISFGSGAFNRVVQIFRVAVPAEPGGQPVGLLGVAVDSAMQRILSAHVEGLIHEMEAQRLALDKHALVTISRADGTYTYVSEAYCQLLGYTRESFYQRGRFELGLAPDDARTPESFSTMVKQSSSHFEIQTASREGHAIHLQSVVVEMRQMNECEPTYFEFCNDISDIKNREEFLAAEVDRRTILLSDANRKLEADVRERTLIEESLRNQHALVKGILESLPEEIVVLDRAGNVLQVNRVWLQFQKKMALPHTLHNAGVDQNFIEHCRFLGGADALQLSETIRAVQDGARPDAELVYEEPSRMGPRWYSIRITVWDTQGRGLLVSLNDITESKKNSAALEYKNLELIELNQQLQGIQTQLVQSEKMASIGQLAAGVAHEINNPLGYINSNVSSLDNYIKGLLGLVDGYHKLLENSGNEGDLTQANLLRKKADFDFINRDLQPLMAETRDGIGRVKRIVQDLKDFSRLDSGLNFEPSDIHQGLNSTLNIVSNEIKYKCEIVLDYGELPLVDCVLSQLNQIFLNLLVNASHAITDSGLIRISTRVVEDHVRIAMTDNGKGIAPEHLQRIFDPFFTTKPIGEGSGLGLSLSYGIIKKHRGRIEVSSKLGEGTTFEIWLPISQPEIAAAK